MSMTAQIHRLKLAELYVALANVGLHVAVKGGAAPTWTAAGWFVMGTFIAAVSLLRAAAEVIRWTRWKLATRGLE